MKVIAVIPARYASTRFPGKPLVDINGKSMIMRVYEQVLKSNLISEAIVATDDERIFNHVESSGGKVVLTAANHISGTDRCAEVQRGLKDKYDVILNVQGDEPFIDPNQIDELISCFNDEKCQIATLVKSIKDAQLLFDENKVKAVLDNSNYALYFSRQAIPFQKNSSPEKWINNFDYLLHIGLYGFRWNVLQDLSQLNPGRLEKSESLEQLRWLENGYKIKAAHTKYESVGIDTPDDLLRVINSIGK